MTSSLAQTGRGCWVIDSGRAGAESRDHLRCERRKDQQRREEPTASASMTKGRMPAIEAESRETIDDADKAADCSTRTAAMNSISRSKTWRALNFVAGPKAAEKGPCPADTGHNTSATTKIVRSAQSQRFQYMCDFSILRAWMSVKGV